MLPQRSRALHITIFQTTFFDATGIAAGASALDLSPSWNEPQNNSSEEHDRKSNRQADRQRQHRHPPVRQASFHGLRPYGSCLFG